jgi:hypothetical protein
MHSIHQSTSRMIIPDKNDNNYMLGKKDMGATKGTPFNDKITKVPGLYNEKGKFQVQVNPVEKYEFFNLT